jgi:hypothetical protein
LFDVLAEVGNEAKFITIETEPLISANALKFSMALLRNREITFDPRNWNVRAL